MRKERNRTTKTADAIGRVVGNEAVTPVKESQTGLKAIPQTPEDPSREQWMQLGETSPALEFWNDPEEDIYTEHDGDPV